MPITANASIEYEMPKNIKDMITKNFCLQFLKELHLIWGFSLEDFCDDCMGNREGTSGWYEAFTSTCRKLNLDDLYKYYIGLPWYDSDLFDYELSQIVVANKLVLPDSELEHVAKYNNLEIEDVYQCFTCGNYFVQDDMYPEFEESDNTVGYYQCKQCNEVGKSHPLEKENAVTVIENILSINKNDYFVCGNCGKIHLNQYKGKQHCLHCEQENVPDTNINVYYRSEMKLNKVYHDKFFPKTGG